MPWGAGFSLKKGDFENPFLDGKRKFCFLCGTDLTWTRMKENKLF